MSGSVRNKMVYSGKFFEMYVASKLWSEFDYPILLNREFLDNRIGRHRECDLIFVTPFKIYCVECKNYKGYVSGNKFDDKWTFTSSGRKSKSQNPYILNKKRIRTIRSKFYSNNYYPPKIENIIVFPDRCKIHVDINNVYNLSDFITLVRMDSVTMRQIYKSDSICNFLEKSSILSEKGKRRIAEEQQKFL